MELTPRQFSLLEYLMRRAGEVVPKGEILEHVWDFAFDGDPNIVEVYVRQLRNASTSRSAAQPADRPRRRLPARRGRGMGAAVRPLAAGPHDPARGAVVVGGADAARRVALVRVLETSLATRTTTCPGPRRRARGAGRLTARSAARSSTSGRTRRPGRRRAREGCSRLRPRSRAAGDVALAVRRRGPCVRTMRDLPDDDETEDYRIWALRTEARPDGRGAVVYVGPSLEAVAGGRHAAAPGLLVGVPLLVALLARGTWVIVGRALRPVERIRAEVATISAPTSTDASRCPDTATRWPASP